MARCSERTYGSYTPLHPLTPPYTPLQVQRENLRELFDIDLLNIDLVARHAA